MAQGGEHPTDCGFQKKNTVSDIHFFVNIPEHQDLCMINQLENFNSDSQCTVLHWCTMMHRSSGSADSGGWMLQHHHRIRPDSRRLSGKAVGRNHTLIHWVVEEQLEPGNRVQTRVEAEADSTTSLLSILLPSSPFSGWSDAFLPLMTELENKPSREWRRWTRLDSDIQPSHIQPRDIQPNQTSSRVFFFNPKFVFKPKFYYFCAQILYLGSYLCAQVLYLGPNFSICLHSILSFVPKF